MKLRRRTWWILGSPVLFIILFVLFLFWANRIGEQQSRLAQERLAAIDEARVIPDEQNAAEIYDEIQASYILPIDINDTELVSEIYAKLQNLLDYDQCYYPALSYSDLDYMSHISTMRGSVLFLREMAFRDLIEDRFTAAFEKLCCLNQISRHLQQQPNAIDFFVYIAVDEIVLRFLSCVIMHTAVTKEHLDMATTLSGQWDDDWVEMTEFTLEVDRLQMILLKDGLRRQSQWRPSTWWYSIRIFFSRDYDIEETIRSLYPRLSAARRMLHIMTELRRYYNENGQWPDTLEEIKSKVPELTLTDPCTEGFFIYKKEGTSFRLYSKGVNGIDEDGSRAGPADDRQFWPPTSYFIKKHLPIQKTLGLDDALQEN